MCMAREDCAMAALHTYDRSWVQKKLETLCLADKNVISELELLTLRLDVLVQVGKRG